MSDSLLTLIPPIINNDVDDDDEKKEIAAGLAFLASLRGDISGTSRAAKDSAYRRQSMNYSSLDARAHPLAKLAARVYLAMRSSNSSQAVFMRNCDGFDMESKAIRGYTAQNLHFNHLERFLTFFAFLTSPVEKRIHRKIAAANRILGALCCVPSSFAPRNATPPLVPNFGLCVELQLDRQLEHGIVGAQLTLLCLERLGLWKGLGEESETEAAIPHLAVFASLLHGATPEQVQGLKLTAFIDSASNARTVPPVMLEEFLNAFQVLGLAPSAHETVLKYIAAILHLRAIQFADNGESTVIRSPDAHLEPAAAFLGIQGSVLSDLLTTKQSSNSAYYSQVYTTLLRPEEAKMRAFQIASTLYSLLINWVVDFSNARLLPETNLAVDEIEDMLSMPEERSSAFESSSLASESVLGAPNAKTRWHRFSIFFAATKQSRTQETGSVALPSLSLEFAAAPHSPALEVDVYDYLSRAVCTVLDEYFGNSFNEFAAHAVQDDAVFARNREFLKLKLTLVSLAAKMDDSIILQAERNAVLEHDVVDVLSKSETNHLVEALFTAYTPIALASDYTVAKILLPTKRIVAGLKTASVLPYLAVSAPANSSCLAAQELSHIKELTSNVLETNVLLPKVAARYSSIAQAHRIDQTLPPREIFNHLIGSLVIKKSMISLGRKSLWLTYGASRILESERRLTRKPRKSTARASRIDEDSELGPVVARAASEFSDDSALSEIMSVVDTRQAFAAGSRKRQSAKSGLNSRGAPFPYFQSAVKHCQQKTSSTNIDNPQFSLARHAQSSTSRRTENPAATSKNTGDDSVTSQSSSRRRWLFFVRICTFFIPGFLLSSCGLKTNPVQTAWREKLVIFAIIILLCALILFLIIGFGPVVCPSQKVYSVGELSGLTLKKKRMTAIHGYVYSMDELVVMGGTVQHNEANLFPLAGYDISAGFAREPSKYCENVANDGIKLTYGNPDQAQFISISASHKSIDGNSIENYLRSSSTKKGTVVILRSVIAKGWTPPEGDLQQNRIIYKNLVYDLSPYYGTLKAMQNNPTYRFLAGNPEISNTSNLDDYIRSNAGRGIIDFTGDAKFAALFTPATKKCFDALFYAGSVDDRNSLKCQVTNYILFAASAVLAFVIFVKFASALQTGSKSVLPAKVDKFVMIQVPCYTEDEGSLRKTIDSAVSTEYEDRQKLLVIICDGMVVGRGNERTTPQIVLDILQADRDGSEDPPSLPYQAIGSGLKQYNMAKLYSGLYTNKGHTVPYLVVIKCGAPSEQSRPGNRGKRDSQMVLMRFLNHLHHDHPMSPLELEMHHHIQNVIGIDPRWYEFLLMIDADTVIFPDSIARLVSFAMTDRDIVGVCGETRLINEKSTFTTMIQVYEYFISHHLSKSFESLFGSVTCLPGCFCMYRIYSTAQNKPLLCHDNVVLDYATTKVETLHKKNLLALGEDRYLTTLILRSFPKLKTKFTPHAQAHTEAPEKFSILLSQRRRWINSTLHNLVELIRLDDLCGLCCFSMRFVVFIDLVSTIIMPATVIYLFYLVYLTITAIINDDGFSLVIVSLVLLAAVYGLQAIVFMIKREFSHIVWMIFYLVAIPIFGFFIPLYSFWNMDDFSWGNTRVITSEKGQKQVVDVEHEEENIFDISMIPHARWSEYQKQVEDPEEIVQQNNDHKEHRASGPLAFAGFQQYANPSVSENHVDVASRPNRSSIISNQGYSPRYIPGQTPMNSSRASLSMPSPQLAQKDLRVPLSMQTMAISTASDSWNGFITSPIKRESNDGMPTMSELESETRRILSSSDLSIMTKRQVRDELSALFGADLSSVRIELNQIIDRILAEDEASDEENSFVVNASN